MVNWLIRLIRKIKNRKGEYEEMAQDTNISTIKGVYVNREISWLKFNERVLEEAQNENSPLCEKLSFLAIYQSNLDEFFMVRVGSLEDQKLLTGDQRENKTKLSPQEQIDAILENVTKLNAIKDNIYENLMKDVETEGFRLVRYADLSKADAKYLDSYFAQEILPLLSVMIVGRKQPFPFLKNRGVDKNVRQESISREEWTETPVAVRGQSNSGEKQRKQKKPVQRKAKTGYDRKETNSDEFWGE